MTKVKLQDGQGGEKKKTVEIEATVLYAMRLDIREIYEIFMDYATEGDRDPLIPQDTKSMIDFLTKVGCFDTKTNQHRYFMDMIWEDMAPVVQEIEIEVK